MLLHHLPFDHWAMPCQEEAVVPRIQEDRVPTMQEEDQEEIQHVEVFKDKTSVVIRPIEVDHHTRSEGCTGARVHPW